MANTFKVITKSDVSNNSVSPTSVYTVQTGVDATVILGILAANKLATSAKVTLLIDSSTSNAGGGTNSNITLAKDVSIPPGSSLEYMSGQKYVMQVGDVLKTYSDTSSAIDISFNFMEIT